MSKFKSIQIAAVFCGMALIAVAPASGATKLGAIATGYSPGNCSGCSYFADPATDGGAYRVPSDGIITSFGFGMGNTTPVASETFEGYIVRPSGALYLMVARTGAIPLQNAPVNSVVNHPVRIPVKTGDLIGDYYNVTNEAGFFSSPSTPSATYHSPMLNPSVGSSFTVGPPYINAVLMNLQATLEPDADGDGFGDDSQDACPTDGSTQGACPAPVLSDFRIIHRRFAVNPKGAVIGSAAPRKGTAISLTLSLPSTVAFSLGLHSSGRNVGGKCVKPTAKNRSLKHCGYISRTFAFTKRFGAGTTVFKYSGRQKVGAKIVPLPLGVYSIRATPTSTQSNVVGPAPLAQFRVLAPAKR